MDIQEINEQLKTQTLTEICKDRGLSRTTVARNFRKQGYQFSHSSKQFEKLSNEAIQTDREDIKIQPRGQEEVKNTINEPVKELVKKPVFKIPNKSVDKNDTTSYTVVSNSKLVNKLDKLVKKKNYKSRNELVNVILEMVVDAEE